VTGVAGATIATIAPTSTTTTVRPAAGCTAGTTTARYRSLPGVEARFTSLDVHNPRGACGLPVWVWVHGGGYRIGDKANQMADKVRLAAERGWLLVSVNYRLTDPADPTAARFPDHYDDVAAAVAWIRSNIAPFGGDANRIALFGHSAGADIVSNVAVVPAHLAAHGLTTVVLDCVGPLDTAGFDKPAALATGTAGAEREEAMWEAALGSDPDWRMSTSATLRIDPARRVPPMLVTVRGAPSRRAIAEGLAAAVRATGAEVVVVEARGLTHNEVNSRIGTAGDTVMTPPIVGFLDRCFAG
jgi:acetyl esterase/lipase